MKPFVCGLILALACLVSRPASAEAILFTGTGNGTNNGSGIVTLNASALFDISGNTLTITLSNLGDTSGTAGADIANNQLAGLFFDLPNGISLTGVSAAINPGGITQYSSCNSSATCQAATDVGGEFYYSTGAYPNGADRGISSGGQTGNLNGNFPTGAANLDNPTTVGGPNFLIIAPKTASNNFVVGNGLGSQPVVEGTVEFQMNIAGGTLHASDLANVSFSYGATGYTGSTVLGKSSQPVPEPATAFLALSGMAIAMKRARKRVRRS